MGRPIEKIVMHVDRAMAALEDMGPAGSLSDAGVLIRESLTAIADLAMSLDPPRREPGTGESNPAVWESISVSDEEPQDVLYRARVFGGWIVSIGLNTDCAVFVPDAKREWF